MRQSWHGGMQPGYSLMGKVLSAPQIIFAAREKILIHSMFLLIKLTSNTFKELTSIFGMHEVTFYVTHVQ